MRAITAERRAMPTGSARPAFEVDAGARRDRSILHNDSKGRTVTRFRSTDHNHDTMSATVTANDRLGFTMFLAIAVHAVLILGLGFAPETPGRAARSIEVTIAHRLSDERPDDADFIAQANQQGAGDLDEKRELTTTEHAPFDAADNPDVQVAMPSTRQPSPVASQRVVITQGISTRQVSLREPDQVAPKPLPRSEIESEQILSQEIASLQARLDRQKQAYASRPRIQRLTSVSAKAHYEAMYIDAFRRDVEDTGTRNFPRRALQEGIFGNVRLLVAINSDGTVREIDVLQSSGHPFLDEAAVQSVRLAAPFGPFTPEMKQNFDILEIIRTWRFDRSETVTSH